MQATGQDRDVELTPIISRILEEVLRPKELGSFNWEVLGEPEPETVLADFLECWGGEPDQAATVTVKRPKVRQENTKGKGRMDAGSTPDEGAPDTRSTRGTKRKLEEEGEEEEEEEGEGMDDDDDEGEEVKEPKQDEGGKKKGGRTPKKVRIKSSAEVNSEDDKDPATETRPHPGGTCSACVEAQADCMVRSTGQTACDRCQTRKQKCSLTRPRVKVETSKKVEPRGESLRKVDPKGESSKKVDPKGESSRKADPKGESLRKADPRGESSKKSEAKKVVKKSTVAGKPPATGSPLLGDKMTVFSNPQFKGTSPIPSKSIGVLSERRGEPVIQVMRSRPDVGGSSEAIREGSVRPGHDQEIPSK